MTCTAVRPFYVAIKNTHILHIFFVLTFTLSQISDIPVSSSINVTNITSSTTLSTLPGDMNKNFSQTGARSKACPIFIGIAPEEGQNNLTEIRCIEKILENCQRFDTSFGYVVGSLKVSIKGITDNDCHISLLYEVERGQSNMTCTIPLDRLPDWINWKRGDGFDAIDDIAKYCTR